MNCTLTRQAKVVGSSLRLCHRKVLGPAGLGLGSSHIRQRPRCDAADAWLDVMPSRVESTANLSDIARRSSADGVERGPSDGGSAAKGSAGVHRLAPPPFSFNNSTAVYSSCSPHADSLRLHSPVFLQPIQYRLSIMATTIVVAAAGGQYTSLPSSSVSEAAFSSGKVATRPTGRCLSRALCNVRSGSFR